MNEQKNRTSDSTSIVVARPSPPVREEHFVPEVIQDLTPKAPEERGVAWKGPGTSSVAVIWFPTTLIQISAGTQTFRGWERASPLVQLTPALAAQVAQSLRYALALRTHVCACGRIHEWATHRFIRHPHRATRHERGRFFTHTDDDRFFFSVTHEPRHDDFRLTIHPTEESSTRGISLTADQLSEIAATLSLIADGQRPFRCNECTQPIVDPPESTS